MALERRRFLDELRERAEVTFQPFPPDMVQSYLGHSAEIERQILLGPEKDRKGVIRVLRRFKREHEEKVPASKLAAQFVGVALAENFELMALREAEAGRIPTFIFFVDLFHGITVTGAIIAGASTSDLSGRSAEAFEILSQELEIDYGGKVPVPGEEIAAMYTLGVTPFYRKFEDLMAQDPTGFKLADYYVSFLRDETQKPPDERAPFVPQYDMTDFVVRGAEIGAAMYKKVFPIARSII